MNLLFFDVDTTGVDIGDVLWRVAFKLPSDTPVVYSYNPGYIAPATLNYLGIHPDYPRSLPDVWTCVSWINNYLGSLGQLFVPVCYSEFDYKHFMAFCNYYRINTAGILAPYPIYITQLVTFMSLGHNVNSFKRENILRAFHMSPGTSPLCEGDVLLTEEIFYKIWEELKGH